MGLNAAYEQHPLDYASCFVAHSKGSNARKCKEISKSNIVDIAKLLAYGDFIEARATQRDVVLDEEISKYPYSRKSELKVGECVPK